MAPSTSPTKRDIAASLASSRCGSGEEGSRPSSFFGNHQTSTGCVLEKTLQTCSCFFCCHSSPSSSVFHRLQDCPPPASSVLRPHLRPASSVCTRSANCNRKSGDCAGREGRVSLARSRPTTRAGLGGGFGPWAGGSNRPVGVRL